MVIAWKISTVHANSTWSCDRDREAMPCERPISTFLKSVFSLSSSSPPCEDMSFSTDIQKLEIWWGRMTEMLYELFKCLWTIQDSMLSIYCKVHLSLALNFCSSSSETTKLFFRHWKDKLISKKQEVKQASLFVLETFSDLIKRCIVCIRTYDWNVACLPMIT